MRSVSVVMYIWGPLEQMQLLKSVLSMSLEGCVSIIRNLLNVVEKILEICAPCD